MRIRDYRAKARQLLAGQWGMAILVTFVASLFGALLVGSGASFNISIDESFLEFVPERLQNILLYYITIVGSIAGLLGMAQFILSGVVQLGYSKYLLKLHDGEDADIKDLFSQFNRFGDGFLLSLLTSIYTFLWTMLFIIPGIVAAYKYAMAPFLMLENPDMSASDAITASKHLMKGHKAALFGLDLSFLGWSLLATLFTLGIGHLWLNPYRNVARASFYRNLRPLQIAEPVVEQIPTETFQTPYWQR